MAIPVIHFISQFSSSFIEEEHQLWYFLSTTFFMTQVIALARKINIYNYWDVSVNSFMYIGVPVIDRVLRIFNQTGDKWAHLPDLGDWLNKYIDR